MVTAAERFIYLTPGERVAHRWAAEKTLSPKT
ncbi:hypothetical protein ARTHRO9V_220008 [Arthrobacter sp. 9V]|nr:hypothetical protein ARTHRO9V_220008 [Arthrobacter sp. 9V]